MAKNETSQPKVTQDIEVSESVDVSVYDGMYAFYQVLKKYYGEIAQLERVGFSLFSGPTMEPGRKFEVKTGLTTRELVPWGEFRVFGIRGTVNTGYKINDDGAVVFTIGGVIHKSSEEAFKTLAQRVRDYLVENSLYRGKAVKMRTNREGGMELNCGPEFIDTTRPVNLQFSKQVLEQIDVNLFTPVEKRKECLEMGIPTKRSILLAGPYGTGKTLTAYATARLCEEHNWTFIMVDKVKGLKSALTFAKQYAPAVVFAEDIDAIMIGERTAEMDETLNTIDGIEFKNADIITVLTTNHLQQLNKAMLRPGRIDAVISVMPPDAEARLSLLQNYLNQYFDDKEDYSDVVTKLDGYTPAFIREIVERAKLLYIKEGLTCKKISANLILRCIVSMQEYTTVASAAKGGDRVLKNTLDSRFKEVLNEWKESMYN